MQKHCEQVSSLYQMGTVPWYQMQLLLKSLVDRHHFAIGLHRADV